MKDLKNLIQQFKLPQESLSEKEKSEMRAEAHRMAMGYKGDVRYLPNTTPLTIPVGKNLISKAKAIDEYGDMLLMDKLASDIIVE